jgi:hypothetical protein
VTPTFDQDNFPSRSGYNSGNVFRKENTKRKNDRADWGFTALEHIFDLYLAVTGSRLSLFFFFFALINLSFFVWYCCFTRVDGYYLYGHSAGAQFIHRHLAFIGAGGHPTRIKKAVAANAGFYTMPTFSVPFPYGFGGTEAEFSMDDLRNYLQVVVGIMIRSYWFARKVLVLKSFATPSARR